MAITKFDEFLIRCGENESDTVVLPRFCSELEKDLRRELFVQDISTLEQAYQLVQDLNRSQDFSFTKCSNYRDNLTRPPLSNLSLVSFSLSLVLNLVTLLRSRSMMIKGKDFQ